LPELLCRETEAEPVESSRTRKNPAGPRPDGVLLYWLPQIVAANGGGSAGLNLDLDVDPGRQLDALQAVDGLGVGIDDVDQTLVDTHLEVLA
jgi:hypothetical protein